MKMNEDYEHLSPEDPVSSKIFFNSILERLKIDLNSPEHILSNQWAVIVGDNLAKSSSFCGIENKVLKVKCTNSSTASLFRMNSREVIKKINSIFPELNIIKVNVRV